MNDQFNYKEIAEEQCNRRYHTEMWKDERVQVLKERDELLAENERLRAALIFVRDKEHAALTEENNRLREALESVRYLSDSSSHTPSKGLMILTSDIATRALEQKP